MNSCVVSCIQTTPFVHRVKDGLSSLVDPGHDILWATRCWEDGYPKGGLGACSQVLVESWLLVNFSIVGLCWANVGMMTQSTEILI